MNKEKMMQTLQKDVNSHSRQKIAADAYGISPQHLSDILQGRREISPLILAYLGFERVVSYRRKEKPCTT